MVDDEYIEEQLTIGKTEIRYLNIFWIGLILYSVGAIFSATEALNIKLCQAVQALGVVAMIPFAILLCRKKIDSAYLRPMFLLYMVWLIFVIFRGKSTSLSYGFIKDFLFGFNNNGLIYLAPLILLFPRKFYYYKKLFQIISIATLVYLSLCVIFIKKLAIRGDDVMGQTIIESLFDLAIPPAFILLTYRYHSNKKNLLAIVAIAITLLFSVIRARRGLIFITSCMSFYSVLFYFFQTRKKFVMIYFGILFIVGAVVYSSTLYNIQSNKLIGFLYERGNEDTRSQVEVLFYDDMKMNDWIVGRGIDGEYFAPDIEKEQVTNFRTVIETGYLQIILKGGLISLGLLLLITVPAIINGIFFSANILSKAAAIWILQFLINLYPQNSVSFNLGYLIVWISVGICYSKEIRNLPDNLIKKMLYAL